MSFQKIARTLGAIMAAGVAASALAQAPVMQYVVVDNLGHLPMIVGAEKGIFKEHGLDVKLKIVKSGTEIMNALKNKEAQGANLGVTTFIKGRQGGEMISVFAQSMNDATRANADDPLAIIARKGSGVKKGDIKSLKGKKIGVWFEQTPDEYLKIVLSKAGMKPTDVELVNIKSNPDLIPQLTEGKVDAVVSLEPWNSMILAKVPGAYLVKRGGGYMSYMMVSAFQDETLKSNPEMVKKFALGLAAASHYTRTHRAEAVELFAKAVPGVDVAITKQAVKHLSYDPRISKTNMTSFNTAQESLITLGSSQADKRLTLPNVVLANYMQEIEKSHPQYFKDLKKVPY